MRLLRCVVEKGVEESVLGQNTFFFRVFERGGGLLGLMTTFAQRAHEQGDQDDGNDHNSE